MLWMHRYTSRMFGDRRTQEYGEKIFAISQILTRTLCRRAANINIREARKHVVAAKRRHKLCCLIFGSLFSAIRWKLLHHAEAKAFSQIYWFYNCGHFGSWLLNLNTTSKQILMFVKALMQTVVVVVVVWNVLRVSIEEHGKKCWAVFWECDGISQLKQSQNDSNEFFRERSNNMFLW